MYRLGHTSRAPIYAIVLLQMNAALCLFFIEVVDALSIALVRCHRSLLEFSGIWTARLSGGRLWARSAADLAEAMLDFFVAGMTNVSTRSKVGLGKWCCKWYPMAIACLPR
jgi:hypothetical protein